MKATIMSLMVTLLLIFGMYVYYYETVTGGKGAGSGSVVANTGVTMDLTALAQAERIYYVQNGSYGSVEQLISNGTMDKLSKGRDGYIYSVEPSETGFTVTAKHDEASGGGKHFPILTINEKMELRHDGEAVAETSPGITPPAVSGKVPEGLSSLVPDAPDTPADGTGDKTADAAPAAAASAAK